MLTKPLNISQEDHYESIKKGEYALRALIFLGNHQGKVLGIQEISDKTMVSIHYLEQYAASIKKTGLLN